MRSRRRAAGRDIEHGELADRLFLLGVGERELSAVPRGCDAMQRAFVAAWPLEHDVALRVGHFSPSRTGDFEMIPVFVRQGKGQRAAGFNVTIPVGQLKVVVATGEARAVVNSGPGGLADAIGGFPPPTLQVEGVVDFDLADGDSGPGRQRRHAPGLVETVAGLPRRADGGVLPFRSGRDSFPRVLPSGEARDGRGVEGVVVDTQFVEIPAAHKIVITLHLVRADNPRVRTKLVERGIEAHLSLRLRSETAIYVEAYAARFVPGEGDVHPRARLGERLNVGRDADAG